MNIWVIGLMTTIKQNVQEVTAITYKSAMKTDLISEMILEKCCPIYFKNLLTPILANTQV